MKLKSMGDERFVPMVKYRHIAVGKSIEISVGVQYLVSSLSSESVKMVYMYLCMYVYIHTYRHTYIHTYTVNFGIHVLISFKRKTYI